jgi:hypothetical protein
MTTRDPSRDKLRTDLPMGWGTDSLSAYIHDAYRNRLGTYANKRGAYDVLSRIDWCFTRIGTDWINPQDPLSPFLFLRSHAAYRAACECALSGQAGELYTQLRACLERAGYCLLLGKRPELRVRWLDRHKDEASMAASRRDFNQGSIRACLTPLDQIGAERFDKLYQMTIDLGGHPNERGVTGNMHVVEEKSRKVFQQVYMHADGVVMDHGLVATARVGLCALETMQNIFGPRYEILGVRAAILDLRRGL